MKKSMFPTGMIMQSIKKIRTVYVPSNAPIVVAERSRNSAALVLHKNTSEQ